MRRPMSTARFDRASVLLFDPSPTRRANRAALEEAGFAHVAMVKDMAQFMRKLQGDAFDLVIAEAFSEGADVCDVVRSVRDGELGANPFLSVLLTTWPRGKTEIRKALDSGADDVVLRPFSTGQLLDRVRLLASANRPYVVTSDYVGPDRRRSPDRGPSLNSFAAPNLLKARVAASGAAVRAAVQAIPDVQAKIARERVRRLALRVATSARMRLEAAQAGEDLGIESLEELDRAARELRRRLRLAALCPDAEALAGDVAKRTTALIRARNAAPQALRQIASLALKASALLDAQGNTGETRQAPPVPANPPPPDTAAQDASSDDDMLDLDNV